MNVTGIVEIVGLIGLGVGYTLNFILTRELHKLTEALLALARERPTVTLHYTPKVHMEETDAR